MSTWYRSWYRGPVQIRASRDVPTPRNGTCERPGRAIRKNRPVTKAGSRVQATKSGLEADVDRSASAPDRPAGAGMYLHWEGRRGYRTRMPAPRVLSPVPDLSVGDSVGNRVIEGDNLQVMVSLRSQYQRKHRRRLLGSAVQHREARLRLLR